MIHRFAQFLPRVLRRVVAAGLATIASAASAQFVTAVEMQMQLVQEALDAYRHARKTCAEYTAEVSRAREAHFGRQGSAADQQKAAATFSRLLAERDLMTSTWLIANGTGEQGQKTWAATNTLTGCRELVIPDPLAGHYVAWIDEVRLHLGATRPNQMIISPSEQALEAAILASKDSYSRYARARDAHETGAYQTKMEHRRIAAEGGFHLVSAEVGDLKFMDPNGPIPPFITAGGPALKTATLAMIKGGQKMLRCHFSWSGSNQGQPFVGQSTASFWHGSAPSNLDELWRLDVKRAYRHLGHSAVAECPKTNDELKALQVKLVSEYDAGRTRLATPAAR